MIAVFGSIQAIVRIDMTMPSAPKSDDISEVSPWERQAYGEGGRFGSMTSIPSGDPSRDKIRVSIRGCAYDVAKYLAAREHKVKFFGLVGNDPLGKAALSDLADAGVDISGVAFSDKMTSVRVEARNFLGDLEFWRVDESIQEDLEPEKAMEMMRDVPGGAVAFADGSLPEATLEALGKTCREKSVKLFFDPASLEGAERGSGCLEYFCGVMPGRREAEVLTGLEILSAEQMNAAGELLAEKGVEKVAITIKGGGIYYREDDKDGIIRPERVLKFAETAGAGDVMTAELINALVGGKSMEEAAGAGMDEVAGFLADVDDERKY